MTTSRVLVRAGTERPRTTPEPPGTSSAALRWALAVVLVCTIASVLLFHRIWADPVGRTVGPPSNDQWQSMWFLKWLPWRLAHGHNPFATTAIDYPVGANLSWNTATPTLAILFAPVTALAGATFTYNLLLTLAPVLTALTGFLWLRRHVHLPAAAALGGVVIGFSPFAAQHLRGHLHMAFLGLLPLVLLLAEDLLWRRPRPQLRTAVYLGIVVAAQLGISEESLLVVAVGFLVATLAYAAADARGLVRAVRTASRPLALAVIVALAAAAPLLVEQFAHGAVAMDNNFWRASEANYFTPTHQLLPGLTGGRPVFGHGEMAVVFVGPLLCAVLVLGIGLTIRSLHVRVAAATLAVLVLITFGDTHWYGIPLPWHFVAGLPGIRAVLPVRVALASWFVIAWLLAHWVDWLSDHLRPQARLRTAGAGTALAAIAVALLALVPTSLHPDPLPPTPAFFTADHPELPRDAPIVLMPITTPYDARAMYWQQRADFRFSMLGGYAYRRDGDLWAPQTPLTRVVEGKASDAADFAAARAELIRDHYRAIVVVTGTADSSWQLRAGRLLTGRIADRFGDGVALWLLH